MKRAVPFIVFGLLLGLSVPAFAHKNVHVPTTEPITLMYVDLFNYKDKERLVCDTPDPTGIQFDRVEGIEPFNFSSMRVHISIDSAGHGLDPSEHWNVHVDVAQAIAKTNGQLSFRTFWDQGWKHQNTSAHQKSHDVSRTNLWRLNDRPGIWRVTIDLEGQESGNKFNHVCIFETFE